ncbi:MAG: dihydrolipoamide acetyltransferase family protein, partial [Fimbriimonadales bacterium]
GSAAPSPKLEVKPAAPTVAGPDQELVPLLGMRKMIAEAMTRSAQVPTVSTLTEVDVTTMVKFREANKESFQNTYGVKLTYTPFFLKAITEALMEFPLVNGALMPDNNIVMNKNVHLGVAVSLGAKGDEGLIVPVIRDCNKKSLIDLAKDLETIAAKARSNALSVADVQGGTFTVTNPGSYGAVLGTPMINAPQAGILGTYTIKKVPAIIDDMIAVRSVMNLVLTYDHRIVDGGLAGRFLLSVKQKLEKFDFFK